MKLDLLLKNGIVFTEGTFRKCNVGVKNGKIAIISDVEYSPDAAKEIDLEGKHLLPGNIDPHVHFRDPSLTARETFYTGTLSAAAGGVTLVLEHPISLPPQYSPEILQRRIDVAAPQSVVDYCFFGAAGYEFKEEIAKLSDKGIVAYKTFLQDAPEGREEEFKGLTMANDGKMLEGFAEVAKTGLICAVHAENNDIIQTLMKRMRNEGRTDYETHIETRPPISEIECVSKILEFAGYTGMKLECAHISTPEAMELIKRAKFNGQEVYLETCPHYLLLTEDKIRELGPFAKCNPPLRDKKRVEGLWKYINDGTVDFIGSDHGPFLLSEKEAGFKDILKAPAGFPGIDLRLPLMLNAVNEGKLTFRRAVELLAVNPAKIFNLYPRKGVISVGSDADFVAVDMNAVFKVSKDKMYTKSRDIALVYEGWELKGKPIYTIVRGRVIMENGVVDESAQGYGEFIKPYRSNDKNDI